MFVKIHSTKEHKGNKASSSGLIKYLEKEDLEKDIIDRENFFNHEEDDISAYKAFSTIDGNVRGLKKDDAKFFMLTVNPSNDELKFLDNDPEKLKAYTRSVMDEYAKGFNREVDGKVIEGKDLVYFAKVERNRIYTIDDPKFKDTFEINRKVEKQINGLKKEIKRSPLNEKDLNKVIEELEKKYVRNKENSIILPGVNKDGLNTHVHIVVARKDKNQRVSLSPFSNSKGSKNTLNGKQVQIGFNRKEFKISCEETFDKSFDYHRLGKDKFMYMHGEKNGHPNHLNTLLHMPTNERELAQKLIQAAIKDSPELQSLMKFKSTPKTAEAMQAKIIKMAIDKIVTAIVGKTIPGAQVIKSLIKASIDMAKGTGMGY